MPMAWGLLSIEIFKIRVDVGSVLGNSTARYVKVSLIILMNPYLLPEHLPLYPAPSFTEVLSHRDSHH